VLAHRFAGEARLAAHRGELDAAATLAHRAVEVLRGTDLLGLRAKIWLALAEVQRAAGASTHTAVASALALYEQKGNVADAERLRTGALTTV
jgi:hypothetical protein